MKKIFNLLCLVFILQACSSDDSNENNSNNNGVVLLKRLERSNDVDIDYFKYNGTKLDYISIGDESGQTWRNQFTYSGDLITKTEWFENNQATGEKDVYTYLNNKISEVRIYSPGAILEYIDNYTYNSDGTVDVITTGYNSSSGGFVKLFLDSNNNVIKKDYLGGYIELFQYDNKNNPYKNITGLDKLYLFENIGYCGKNNITNDLSYNKTFSYQYNNQNYPISCEILRPGQFPVVYTFYY
jgi:hypothetical protein